MCRGESSFQNRTTKAIPTSSHNNKLISILYVRGGPSRLRWNHVVGTLLVGVDGQSPALPPCDPGFNLDPELDRDNFLVGGA